LFQLAPRSDGEETIPDEVLSRMPDAPRSAKEFGAFQARTLLTALNAFRRIYKEDKPPSPYWSEFQRTLWEISSRLFPAT
jgi:hypothetical protein